MLVSYLNELQIVRIEPFRMISSVPEITATVSWTMGWNGPKESSMKTSEGSVGVQRPVFEFKNV